MPRNERKLATYLFTLREFPHIMNKPSENSRGIFCSATLYSILRTIIMCDN